MSASKYPDSICWSCKKALGKCSWSNGTFKPVDGWNAVETQVKIQHGRFDSSYAVMGCPLFVKDGD